MNNLVIKKITAVRAQQLKMVINLKFFCISAKSEHRKSELSNFTKVYHKIVISFWITLFWQKNSIVFYTSYSRRLQYILNELHLSNLFSNEMAVFDLGFRVNKSVCVAGTH